jgi:hypothetical protein
MNVWSALREFVQEERKKLHAGRFLIFLVMLVPAVGYGCLALGVVLLVFGSPCVVVLGITNCSSAVIRGWNSAIERWHWYRNL